MGWDVLGPSTFVQVDGYSQTTLAHEKNPQKLLVFLGTRLNMFADQTRLHSCFG